MGLFSWFSKFFLIVLILNLVDTIICIVWPILTNNIHHFPSMTETLYTIVYGPAMFSTRLKITFQLGRAIILILTLATLIAITTAKKFHTIRTYEFIILLMTLIWLAVTGYNELSGTSIGSYGSLVASVAKFVFVQNIGLVALALLYHLPFAISSFLIYMGIYRYREFLMELRITRVPKEGSSR